SSRNNVSQDMAQGTKRRKVKPLRGPKGTRGFPTMNLSTILLFAQLALPARASHVVLEFPEPGLDDTAAYAGYRTRFFRDAAGNTVQIYLDGRSGRVVHLLADAEGESAGFTARDSAGKPAALRWRGDDATVSAASVGPSRSFTYDLVADATKVYLGWFLLGSMRVERDLQYSGRHQTAFRDAPFPLPEFHP